MTLKYRDVMTVGAIISILFGLAFLVLPTRFTSFYNIELNAGGDLIGRLFGAALIGLGLINWLGRDLKDVQAKRALLTGNAVGTGLGSIIALIGQLMGVGGINSLGWTTVIIYLLMTLDYTVALILKVK
jgi:hypothetical protein